MIKEATHNECFAVSFARACEYLESTASSHRDPTVHSCNLRGGDHRSASSRTGLTTHNSSNTMQTSMPHRCLLGMCGNNEPNMESAAGTQYRPLSLPAFSASPEGLAAWKRIWHSTVCSSSARKAAVLRFLWGLALGWCIGFESSLEGHCLLSPMPQPRRTL